MTLSAAYLVLVMLNGTVTRTPMPSLAVCEARAAEWRASAQAKTWLKSAECKTR